MTAETHDGYILGVEYPKTIYPKLSPVEIDFVLTQRGVAVPDESSNQRRYCELGCGHGYTTVLLAAMDPGTEYLGIDVNPRHIDSGRKLALDAGVKNVQFLECSIRDALAQDLGPFDWISLHGLISWVSESVETEIMEFVKTFLKLEGRLMISYNAMPGKSQLQPLSWILKFFQKSNQKEDNLENTALKAIQQLQEMLNRKAKVFTQNVRLGKTAQKLGKQPIEYMIHEYLHKDWRSYYFIEIAEKLRKKGLKFVGSVNYFQNIDEYRFTLPMLSHINSFDDPIIREQVRDYYSNADFRMDVYCSQIKTLTAEQRLNAWRNTCFGLTRSPAALNSQMRVSSGTVSLDRPVFWETVACLKQGPKKMAEMEDAMSHSSQDILKMALLPLLATNQIKPMSAAPQAASKVARLNRLLVENSSKGEDVMALGTKYGIALRIPFFEQVYLSIRNGNHFPDEDQIEIVQKTIENSGRVVQNENAEPIQNDMEAHERIRHLLEEMESNKIPTFKKLGVL